MVDSEAKPYTESEYRRLKSKTKDKKKFKTILEVQSTDEKILLLLLIAKNHQL